jgi:YQGE family putative transporter
MLENAFRGSWRERWERWSQIDGREIMGCLIDINGAYRLVTVGVIIVTLFAVAVLWRGKFANPVQKNFLYLWD